MSSTAFRAPIAADAAPADSLTGPTAHCRAMTVDRQRATNAEESPELLALVERLCGRARLPSPGVEGGAG